MHRTLCILKLVHPGFILIICIRTLKLDVFCTDCVKEGALQSAALHRILYNVKEGLLYTEMLTVSESAGMLSAGVFVFVLVFASDICHQC